MDEEAAREALVNALRDFVTAAGGGAYMTDFVIIAAAATPNDPDATTYITEASDGPIHHRLGLVRYLSLRGDRLVGDDE